MEEAKRREEREKEEVIELLRQQLKVEGELIGLYEKTGGEIMSIPVRHLLHSIQLDSRKHIDICQTAIEVLQGEDIVKAEKKELIEGLRRHIELEKDSIERDNKILDNVWIRENKGLRALINKMRDDEKEHHKVLVKLTDKEFFRVSPTEWIGIFQDLEARYEKYERKKKGETGGSTPQ